KGVRKKLSQELGFLVTSIHIRDNLDLSPNRYRVTLMGVTMAEADVYPERSLAINPGEIVGAPLDGIHTKDPAFGMDAVWIEAHQVDQAQMQGYTVVDCSTVIATHISQILREHASELLGREEVQRMLDKLAETYPKLVEDLVPDSISLSGLHRVLKNLLDEQIPLRDMRTIAENLASETQRSQDPAVLTAAVRVALGRFITSQINDMKGEIEVLALDAGLERILQESNVTPGVGGLVIEPGLAEGMCQSLIECARRQEAMGKPVVLLVAPGLRPYLASFARQVVKDIHVLSYEEIPDKRNIRVVATVGGAH
ncbi:MAG: flagellar biosynthesis protein FlhA, partial [Gammaproteobacteria bacterium]|nr:flagellar biosynthesis protein FlhA [Gammaproteobacteria bacterium]